MVGMANRVSEGDVAPNFSLPAQDGRVVSLTDFLGKKNVVLYFYPKDFTIGCTAEARNFSENYEELMELNAEVVGVSSDTAESHSDFAEECHVKYPLLSDRGGRVREIYGIKSSFGLIPGRVTFVIGSDGIVRHVFSSQISPKRHVAEAIESLKKLD